MRLTVLTAGALALPLALAAGCTAGRHGPPGGGNHRSPAVADAAGQHRPVPVLVAKATSKVAYVLATAGQGTRATELFRTTDGGRHFSQVSAPVLGQGGTGRPLPVRIMTFANARDGVVVLGSASRPDRLLVTDDGAQHWRPANLGGRGAITAVAGHGRLTYALRLSCGKSTDVCHNPRLYRAAAGSAAWTRTAASGTAGANGAAGIGLAAWGTHVWLTTGNGVAPAIGLLSSGNSGQSFSQVTSVSAVACFPAPGSAGVIWLWCSGGMLVTFDRLAASTGRLSRLHVTGAGTGNTFLSPLSGRQVLFGTADGGNSGRIYLSRDAGRRFVPVGWLPGPAHGLDAQMTFLTARRALALVSQRMLMRTSDGGRTWTRVTL